MLNTTTFVGLDVHARSIKAVALDAMTGEVRSATFGYDAAEVAGWVSSVDPSAKCVYESGVTGFDLQKRLSSMGIDCVVGAVSKMIKPSADRRRKNDRNDAEFLARMLSVGNVVEVWVPDDECEAARDLTRALDDAREDLKRCKQRLSKFLLRHGLVFSETNAKGQRKKNWTAAHWAWIRSISFPDKADDEVLAYYIDAARQAMEDKARLGRGVQAQVEEEGRLRQVPERHRRDERRRPRLRGRRVLQVQERQVVRGVDRADAVGALQRRERAAGRHHEGGQQASEAHARRVGVALPGMLSPFERPGQRPSAGPRREAPCRQGREKARRQTSRDARARRPQEQGQRRDRPRARMLVLGDRPHGRERLALGKAAPA